MRSQAALHRIRHLSEISVVNNIERIAKETNKLGADELAGTFFERDLEAIKAALINTLCDLFGGDIEEEIALLTKALDIVFEAIEIKKSVKKENNISKNRRYVGLASDESDESFSGRISVNSIMIQESSNPAEAFLQYFFNNPSSVKGNSESILKLAQKIRFENKYINIDLAEILKENHKINQEALLEFIRLHFENFIKNFGFYGFVEDAQEAIANFIQEIICKGNNNLPILLYRDPSFFRGYLNDVFYFELICFRSLLWLSEQNRLSFIYDPELTLTQNIAIEILAARFLSISERKIPTLVTAAKKLLVATLKNQRVFVLLSDDITKMDWNTLFSVVLDSRELQEAISILRNKNLLSVMASHGHFSPRKLVTEIIARERESFTNDMVDSVVKELESVLSEDAIQIDQFSENFFGWVRAICNRLELSDLYMKLAKIFGEHFADKILSDWECIGHDIRDNRAVLTAEAKGKILQRASQRFNAENMASDLRELEEKLTTGELPALPSAAKKQFPRLFQASEDSNTAKANLILNRALVIQQLKNPHNLKPDFIERAIFQSFGLALEGLDSNKEFLHQKMRLLLNSREGFELSSLASFDEIKARMQALQCQARFESAGGDKKLAPYIPVLKEMLTAEFQKVESLCARKISEAHESLGSLSIKDYPKRMSQLKKKYAKDIKDQFNFLFEGFLKLLNTQIIGLMENNSVQDFNKKLSALLSQFDITKVLASAYDKNFYRIEARAKKLISIYEKYKGNLVVEMIQGLEDEQEIFLQGVCAAITVRLTEFLEAHPEAGINEQLEEHLKVKPFDRFFQSAYTLRFKLDESLHYVSKLQSYAPQKIAKKLGSSKLNIRFNFWKKDSVNPVDTFASLKTALREDIKTHIKEGGGLFVLSVGFEPLGAHAALLIVDEKNNRFGFFDCNFGLFRFLDFDQAIDGALDILNYYGEIKYIQLSQNIAEKDEKAKVVARTLTH